MIFEEKAFHFSKPPTIIPNQKKKEASQLRLLDFSYHLLNFFLAVLHCVIGEWK
jgi:hypothetical protein